MHLGPCLSAWTPTNDPTPPGTKYSAEILEQSIAARNRVGIGLSYRARSCKHLRSPGINSASLFSLACRFVKQGCPTGPPGWESIPGILKRFTDSGSGPPAS